MKLLSRAPAAADPGPVMRIGGTIMLALLLTPLIFWVQNSQLADGDIPRCDSVPVIRQLRETASVRHPRMVADVIRDIQSVGYDPQIGHRICMATLGEGAAARQLKFAISRTNSSPPGLHVEAVSD